MRASAATSPGRVAIDFGLYGVPETYLVDAGGIVRWRWAGALTATSCSQTAGAAAEGGVMIAAGACCCWLLARGAGLRGEQPGRDAARPAQEQRAEAIGHQLRCLVCQNESVEQSDADLARDLRRIIRQRVAAGDSDQQVIDWMVARYGDFVRLRPPFDALTLVLWAAPVLALRRGRRRRCCCRRRTGRRRRPRCRATNAAGSPS